MAIYIFECDPTEREYWQEQFPHTEVFCHHAPLTTVGQANDIAHDAEVISTFIHSEITEEVLSALPNVKCIVTRSTGFNHINVTFAEQQGIAVCNVPSYGENTVAEHAFALLLSISRNIIAGANRAKKADFSTGGLMGFDLRGKTLGVVGTGRIGHHMLKMAAGFEMNLIGFDLYPDEKLTQDLGVTYRSLEEVMREADIISLHLNLTETTHHIINHALLEQCKSGVVLINTARGELVETEALIARIQSGHIAAAGLDVVEGEDFLQDHEVTPTLQALIDLPQVLLTPHMAFDSKEAVQRIRQTSVDDIRGYYTGTIQNQVRM